ncbi:hypothetical protein QR680_004108 [Steinernema hermaphroditum]|uniref:Glycine N-acyltransferase-like protein n=1 Tax=Steinernema hermaphroditum TaxID=289476 RepID=A0AA39HMP0_9BILA|nr:hypothetical protein QR680_004108 [Steinernema hermaphroditum]
METKLRGLLELLSPYECPCTFHAVRSRLQGLCLEMEMDFWHKNIQGIDVFLIACLRENQSSVIRVETSKPIREAEAEEFFPLFEECEKAYPLIYEGPLFLAAADLVSEAFKAFLAPRKIEFTTRKNPVQCFYMTPAQQEKVMALNIALPEGYRFDKANLEKDAEVITNTWIHSGPYELEQTKLKLKYCPSALVRFGNEPVGFEISTPFGIQNHLFVVEDHRQKGLGKAVEMKMSQECIKFGNVPFKFVELWNESVLKRSKKDPIWTHHVDENGEPITTVFTIFTPKTD